MFVPKVPSNVTLTRCASRLIRDVSRQDSLRCISTATRQPLFQNYITTRRPFMPAQQRANQISNQLRQSCSTMSNNAELQQSSIFNVKDKIALVTGGGSGIGLMITQTLAVNGAKVYIVGRTEEKLEKVVEAHGKDISGQIIPVVGDVQTKDGVQKILNEIESKEKYLDILVNNAGIAYGKTSTKVESAEEFSKNMFGETSEKEWLDTYQTNVVGPFLMGTAFLPLLAKGTEQTHGWSSTIVNISSISGHVRISQDHFSYNASKGATIHLNKMLATEIAKNGIKVRVNSIAPGVFPSEMTTQESSDKTQKSEMPKEKKEGLPAQRPGKDTDMAQSIMFVTTCQYLNGQTITVDGGYSMQAGN
ncbi:NAD(P)-binding protein [Macroventuria anomochaeta]|uniref:NAD(P)-binding protein n=1 Tax=Macroventuria anomochaeta TaxID=301207 RepID=A0ACB6S956_9PLEO|nr:NAD(P)-binding protein [Macroventuria anomochaeta]KAF2629754.1 NAD(P)-binding protein [Macroventuria anomochaeta]